MNGPRIAICSQKGGVGKTTLALNLGLALSQLGHATTIVELDPQESLAASLLRPNRSMAGLHEVVRGGTTLEDALVHTKVSGLSLLPVGDVDPLEAPDFHTLLSNPEVLGPVLDGLDAEIVLLDCPSGITGATLGALGTSTHALIPVQAEPLSLRSVHLVLEAMARVREHQNPGLSLLGLVLMMFDRDAEASLEVVRSAWRDLDPDVLFETIVPRNPVYLEASLHGVPVGFMAAGIHPEGRRFQMLAGEILDRLAVKEETHAGPVQTLL